MLRLMSFKIDTETRKFLEMLAQKRDISMSAVIRLLIRQEAKKIDDASLVAASDATKPFQCFHGKSYDK